MKGPAWPPRPCWAAVFAASHWINRPSTLNNGADWRRNSLDSFLVSLAGSFPLAIGANIVAGAIAFLLFFVMWLLLLERHARDWDHGQATAIRIPVNRKRRRTFERSSVSGRKLHSPYVVHRGNGLPPPGKKEAAGLSRRSPRRVLSQPNHNVVQILGLFELFAFFVLLIELLSKSQH